MSDKVDMYWKGWNDGLPDAGEYVLGYMANSDEPEIFKVMYAPCGPGEEETKHFYHDQKVKVMPEKWVTIKQVFSALNTPDPSGDGYDDACETITEGFLNLLSALGLDPDHFVDDAAAAYVISKAISLIAEGLKPLNLKLDDETGKFNNPATGELLEFLAIRAAECDLEAKVIRSEIAKHTGDTET